MVFFLSKVELYGVSTDSTRLKLDVTLSLGILEQSVRIERSEVQHSSPSTTAFALL